MSIFVEIERAMKVTQRLLFCSSLQKLEEKHAQKPSNERSRRETREAKAIFTTPSKLSKNAACCKRKLKFDQLVGSVTVWIKWSSDVKFRQIQPLEADQPIT